MIDFGKYRDAEPVTGNYSSCFYCGAGVPGGYFNDNGEEFCLPCFEHEEQRRRDDEEAWWCRTGDDEEEDDE